MSHTVSPVVVGYWSNTGDVPSTGPKVGDVSGNAFLFPRCQNNGLPRELFTALLTRFSYPGGWILTKSNGI